MANTQSITAGNAFIRLSIDSSGLDSELSKVQNSCANFAAGMQSIFGSAKFVGDTLTAPIKNSVNVFGGFEDAMLSAKNKFNDFTEEGYGALYEKAKELGRTTSWTAQEVGAGIAQLAQSTGSIARSAAMIEGVMDAARATNTAIDTTADFAVQAMNQFGLANEDAAHVLDVMVAVSNSSAQTFEDLGWAFTQCGKLAKESGYSFEDTAAAVGMLANLGIKGTAAGTSMKSMLVNLSKPSKEVKKVFDSIGLDIKDPSGNLRPLRDILVDMLEKTKGLDAVDRNEFFANVFGMRGLPGALGLANASVEDFEAMTQAVASADGAAAETAATMDSGIGGALRRLKSALEGVQIAIAEGVKPELEKLIDAFTPLVTKTAEFVKENPKLVLALGLLGGAFTAAAGGAFMANQCYMLAANAFNAVATAAKLLRDINVVAIGESLASSIATISAGNLAGMAAVAVGIYAIAKNLFAAKTEAQQLKEQLDELTGKNNQIRAEDFQKYKHLISMEGLGELSAEQLGVAQTALEELQKTYGDIGVKIEGNRVVGAAAGFGGFKELVKRSALDDLYHQLSAADKVLNEFEKPLGKLALWNGKSEWDKNLSRKMGTDIGRDYENAKAEKQAIIQKIRDINNGFFGVAVGEDRGLAFEGAGLAMDAAAINTAMNNAAAGINANLNVTVPASPVLEAGAQAQAEQVEQQKETNRLIKQGNDEARENRVSVSFQ